MWIGKVSMFKVKTSSLLKQVYFKFCSWNSILMSETVRNLGSGLGTRSHCGIHKSCQASLAKKWSGVRCRAGLGIRVRWDVALPLGSWYRLFPSPLASSSVLLSVVLLKARSEQVSAQKRSSWEGTEGYESCSVQTWSFLKSLFLHLWTCEDDVW